MMTLATLSERLTEAAPNRLPPERSRKRSARKVRNVDAFTITLAGGAFIWTSMRLADRWADRNAGEFIHPALIDGAVAGRA